jgi:hypothetical protein
VCQNPTFPFRFFGSDKEEYQAAFHLEGLGLDNSHSLLKELLLLFLMRGFLAGL